MIRLKASALAAIIFSLMSMVCGSFKLGPIQHGQHSRQHAGQHVPTGAVPD